MGVQSFDERTVLTNHKLVLPADGTASTALVTFNSGDVKIETITVANRDTIAHVVNLLMVNGGTTINLGSASIPAGQGYAGTPTLDLLLLVLPATQQGVLLKSNDVLNIQLAVAIQATFDMSFRATGGVF